MTNIPISVQGYRKLEEELARLKSERPAIIQAIKEAREEGDLRENAGYDAARERQGMAEARIKYIESRLALYQRRQGYLRLHCGSGGCGQRRKPQLHHSRPGRG